MLKEAENQSGKKLTILERKFHFFDFHTTSRIENKMRFSSLLKEVENRREKCR